MQCFELVLHFLLKDLSLDEEILYIIFILCANIYFSCVVADQFRVITGRVINGMFFLFYKQQ